MPKIKHEEEDEEDDDDQFDEEELEQEEEEVPVRAKGKATRAPSPARVGLPKNIHPPQAQPPKRRYGVVPAQPVRIVDVEGEEVLAEGEYIVAQALADIIERLERIENTIGSMVDNGS